MGEGFHQSLLQDIVADGLNRDRPGGLLRGASVPGAAGQDRVGRHSGERRRNLRGIFIRYRETTLDPQILAFDKPQPSQLIERSRPVPLLASDNSHDADAVDPPGFLRGRDSGVENRAAGQQHDQVAAPWVTSPARYRGALAPVPRLRCASPTPRSRYALFNPGPLTLTAEVRGAVRCAFGKGRGAAPPKSSAPRRPRTTGG